LNLLSSVLPTNPTAVPSDIANLVLALGYRDKGSGSLQLDLVNFYADDGILHSLERIGRDKAERLRQQKRAYEKKRRG
jgi:hypothetical protein